MPLRLMIISVHRESMGGAYVQEFKACGGTIGRSLECDWPLPDSKRFVSSKHAMIDHQAGSYYIVDLSRNGVFVNGSEKAVGENKPQRIFDGDKIRIGEYEMQAAVVEDEVENTQSRLNDSIMRAQLVAEEDPGDLSLISSEHLQDAAALDLMLKPTKVEDREDQAALRQAADKFLSAAGLNPHEFHNTDPILILENAAKVLASLTGGMQTLLKSSNEIRSSLGLKGRTGSNNPLVNADGAAAALTTLLTMTDPKGPSSTAAVDVSSDELLRLQRAVISALRERELAS